MWTGRAREPHLSWRTIAGDVSGRPSALYPVRLPVNRLASENFTRSMLFNQAGWQNPLECSQQCTSRLTSVVASERADAPPRAGRCGKSVHAHRHATDQREGAGHLDPAQMSPRSSHWTAPNRGGHRRRLRCAGAFEANPRSPLRSIALLPNSLLRIWDLGGDLGDHGVDPLAVGIDRR